MGDEHGQGSKEAVKNGVEMGGLQIEQMFDIMTGHERIL
jgi:hypothetical protein